MKLWSNIVMVILQLVVLAAVLGVAVYTWNRFPRVSCIPPVPIEYEATCPRANWLGRQLSESVRTAADGAKWRPVRCIYKGAMR